MVTGISSAIVVIRAQDLATRPLKGIAGAFSRVGATLSQVGLMMTATMTVPIMGAGVAIGKLATDFDKSMKNIQAYSRATDFEINTLAKTFTSWSQNINATLDTPKKLAESYFEIEQAGFKGASGLEVLRKSTMAATAGLAETIDVQRAVTAYLNAYGKGAQDAGHATDVMVKAVDLGVFLLPDLVQQMGQFISTAGMLSIPIEEWAATLTTATKKGMNMDEATTSLNRVLLAFLKPAPKAAQAAAELGINLSSSTIDAYGFAGALKLIAERTKFATAITAIDRDERLKTIDAQITQIKTNINLARSQKRPIAALENQLETLKLQRKELVSARFDTLDYIDTIDRMAKAANASPEAIAAIFPDIRSLRLMYSLLSDDMEMYIDDTKKLYGAASTAAATYRTQIKSFSATLQNFRNNVSIAGISIGNELMPMIKALALAVIPLTQKFVDLSSSTKQGVLMLAGIAAVAGPALILLGVLASSVGSLVSVFFGLLKLPILLSGRLIGVVTKGGPVLIGFFASLNVWAWIIVAAIAALAMAWRNNWFGMRDAIMEAWPGIEEIFIKSLSWLKTELPKGIDEFESAWKGLNTTLQAKTTYGRKIVALEGLKERIEMTKVSAMPDITPEEAKQLQVLSNKYKMYQADIIKMLGNLDKLKEAQQKVAEGAFPPGGWVGQVAHLQNTIIRDFGSIDFAEALRDKLEWAFIRGGDVDFTKLTGEIKSGIAGTTKSAAITTVTAANDLNTVVQSAINSALESVKDSLLSKGGDLVQLASNLYQRIMAALGGGGMAGLTYQTDILSGIYGTGTTGVEDFQDKLQKALDAASQTWQDEFGAATDMGVEHFDDAMSTTLSNMRSKIQNMFDKGINVSINLGDLRPGQGNLLAAGANGPFEALYRIQDIAIHGGGDFGIDTKKWMEIYGLGRETATEIVKKFQMGLWDETVTPYIDFQKIIDIAKLEEAAKDSLAGIADQVAQAALAQGVSPQAIQKTLINLGVIQPTVENVASIVQPAAVAIKTAFDNALEGVADGHALGILLAGTGKAIPALPPLVPGIIAAFDQQVIANATVLEESGGKLWTKLESGITKKAKDSGVLYDAVYGMVESILASELS